MALKESDFRPGQIDALIKKAAEQKAAKEAASETPTQKSDTTENQREETATPEYLPPSRRKDRDSHHGPSRALAVRVVEHHPSVDPQPVKLMEGKPTSSEKIVKSVEHLEGSTKVGFKSLADIFRELFGSLKNLGRGTGPAGSTPQSRTYDPARPEPGTRPYTRQADKAIQYGRVWHEKVRDDWFTTEGLKNKLFDRNGLVGGYAHKFFDQRRDDNTYVEQRRAHSKATLNKINSLDISQAEKDARIAEAKTSGDITEASDRDLRKTHREINKQRNIASKEVGKIDRLRALGWSKEQLESAKITGKDSKLEGANDVIANLDPIERKKIDRYRKRRVGWSDTDEPTREDRKETHETPEIGSAEKPYVWQGRSPQPADPSTPLEGKRSKDAAQSSEESQEEARQLDQEFLDALKGVERNTAPILDISKFLLGDKSDNKGETTNSGPTSPGIFNTIKDYMNMIPGKKSMAGMAMNFLGRNVGKIAAPAAGLVGAYDAYSGMGEADRKLSAGEISEDQATVEKGRAVGGGVAGAFGGGYGAVIGAGLGSFLGPAGTVLGGMAGGYLGNMIGSGVGGVVGETATSGYQSIRNGVSWLTGGDSKNNISAVESNQAESLRPVAIPTSVPASPTVNAVSNVTNNSTKVIQPPTRATNDDPTVGRYQKTRWG